MAFFFKVIIDDDDDDEFCFQIFLPTSDIDVPAPRELSSSLPSDAHCDVTVRVILKNSSSLSQEAVKP